MCESKKVAFIAPREDSRTHPALEVSQRPRAADVSRHSEFRNRRLQVIGGRARARPSSRGAMKATFYELIDADNDRGIRVEQFLHKRERL